MSIIEVRNLSKSFDGLKAVDDISFQIPEGSIFGLLGRNGAGKTTTIRMLLNIFMPDEGQVLLNGEPITPEFRNKVGYLPEERGLYKKMKVWDTLLYFAEIKGCSGKELIERAKYYLKLFSLEDRKNSKIEELSKGNQQKVQFITTILHDPDYLIFDEPFSGLDPINIDILKNLIVEFKNNGKIILLSTHLMDFAEKMCDHIVMIEQGKLILNGSLRDIKDQYSKNNVIVEYKGNIQPLKESPIIDSLSDSGNTVVIKLNKNHNSQELLNLLISNNIEINKYIVNEVPLHEIFVSLVGVQPEEGKEYV